MRLPRRSLALATLALSACFMPLHAAEQTLPLLRGVLLDGAGNLFCLADATGTATWAKIGQTHEGWKLESFDADKQVLVVSRDGATRELTLETARIKAEDIRATTAEADSLLEKMRFEEMIAKSIEMQQKAMAKSMSQMAGKNMSDADKARMADIQEKAVKIMVDEMDLPGMRQDMAKAMTEIYTAEELRAQTAFYSTAAGQSSLEKQPQLQSRIAELMMPRMMKAMPKIQTMVRENTPKPAPKPAPAAPAPAAP